MTKLSLGGNLPAATVSNGLGNIADHFVEQPDTPILAIVELGVNYIKEYPRSGDAQPVLQILHIEPLAGVNAKLKAEGDELLNKAFTKRTGEKFRPDPTRDQLDIPAVDDEPEA